MGKSKAIPGYVGALQVCKAFDSADSPQYSDPLPIWRFEYGGAFQPASARLASGIPYPDVFPDDQNVEQWTFAGPARTDFNPWSNSGLFAALAPGNFAPGQVVGAKITIYPGSENLGQQIGSAWALITGLRWVGVARGQTAWVATLAGIWLYVNTLVTAPTAFRQQGRDTFYNLPLN